MVTINIYKHKYYWFYANNNGKELRGAPYGSKRAALTSAIKFIGKDTPKLITFYE